jgi:hypothetical protein
MSSVVPTHEGDAMPCGAPVVFGFTGHLAKKKIIPSLYAMVKKRTLTVPVIGVASDEQSDDEIRKHVRDKAGAPHRPAAARGDPAEEHAYERLLGDAMNGDLGVLTNRDASEAARTGPRRGAWRRCAVRDLRTGNLGSASGRCADRRRRALARPGRRHRPAAETMCDAMDFDTAACGRKE